jgi:hypothetical protein
LIRKPWTQAELATLRALYPVSTAIAVARRLGCSVTRVYNGANAYGLKKSRTVPITRKFLATVRRLHKAGWSDPDIAAELGCERHTISRHRKRLGLPSNQYGQRHRDKVRETTARQLEAAGVPTLADVRAKAFRSFAESRGWPADLPPRAVMILDALEIGGVMTRRQIADAIGMPWKGSRHSLKSNGQGGSYLARLMRAGLVMCLGRLKKGRGPGRSVCGYSLALTAERKGTIDESEVIPAADAKRPGVMAGPDAGGILRGDRTRGHAGDRHEARR